MFCIQCGKTVPGDAQFCVYCGTSIPESARQTSVLTSEAPSSSGWTSEPLASTPTPGYGEPPPVQPVGSVITIHETPRQMHPDQLQPLPSGNDPALINQLPAWSWGGFLLGFIWAACHGAWLMVAVDLIGGLIFPFGNRVIIGFMGNREAWKYRRFSSLEEFHAVQRKWAIGGLIVWLLSMALMVVLVAVIILAANASN